MKSQQNKFYTSISKYYSEIFPYNPMQLKFVKNRVGDLTGKSILDIGCANGELAFQLAKEGTKVTGIDLNADLLEQAESKNVHQNIEFRVGNMLDLESDFHSARYDVVMCFGNTLVHLQTKQLVGKMLKGVCSILKPGGNFLLQILNYDYIIGEQITKLPLLETKNIKFIRNYSFEENSQVVRFQTDLILKKEKETISNETLLLALKSAELWKFLQQAGFSEIELFSNFKMEPFGKTHLPLVVSCKK